MKILITHSIAFLLGALLVYTLDSSIPPEPLEVQIAPTIVETEIKPTREIKLETRSGMFTLHDMFYSRLSTNNAYELNPSTIMLTVIQIELVGDEEIITISECPIMNLYNSNMESCRYTYTDSYSLVNHVQSMSYHKVTPERFQKAIAVLKIFNELIQQQPLEGNSALTTSQCLAEHLTE